MNERIPERKLSHLEYRQRKDRIQCPSLDCHR